MAPDSMARIADAVNVKFDKVVPMVIGPSVVAAGANTKKLFMAGAASGVTRICSNGQQLSVITDAETSIKMAKVEFAASGEGLQSQYRDSSWLGKPPITRKIGVHGNKADYPVLPTVTRPVCI